MTLQGVDYALGPAGPLSAAQLKANGLSFAIRYVSWPGYAKNLTQAEVANFWLNGIGIVVVFQQAASNPLGGNAKGISDATTANAQVTTLGLAGCPIYFAVDFAPTAAQEPMVDAYLQGAVSVLGLPRVGVYAPYPYLAHALSNSPALATYAWQSKNYSVPSTAAAVANIFQYNYDHPPIDGVAVDIDMTIASDANYGQATVVIPVVSGLAPATGSTDGGTLVTITGTGFTGATAVQFGPNAASAPTVNSTSQMTAVSPAATDPPPLLGLDSNIVNVTVTNPSGTSFSWPIPVIGPPDPSQFTY